MAIIGDRIWPCANAFKSFRLLRED
ncbi:hypothetical protein AZE42_12338 [Rhizopogon vesiculosus]|uniref:Uncharacterized protein n=1 Tax=Rhizopogon vesiculosus TaxID=180088 RepID=A0A1J8Q9J4_9AGAM|nr:hypothetical protein AZE42_12338 [Rhizopogon vesiculosus]